MTAPPNECESWQVDFFCVHGTIPMATLFDAASKRLPADSPRIKVCGVKRPADVVMLAEEGVEAVGINLVPTSPRSVPLEQAAQLADIARQAGLKIAVVVRNPTGEQLRRIADAVPADYLQLHGQELPEMACYCGSAGIIKAVSWSGREAERELARRWREPLRPCDESAPGDADPSNDSRWPAARLQAILVDAYAPATGGGTGRTARWDLLAPRPNEFCGIHLLLAGGLRPDNVAAAIRATRPEGVDTASGVELSPGVKSRDLVRQFVAEARRALADLPGG